MSETICKLQPNRTMHLRGFDDRGAAAAMHSATADSFIVEGVFRDAADFCVLIVYDADDYFGHPRHKYLPSFSFEDIVLTFDVKYTNLRALDSALYPSIDWPYLDVIKSDGSTAQIRLSDHFIAGAAVGWQRIELDFTALAIDSVRQMWLTFAPAPTAGVAYAGAEWKAEFDNWTVSDPSSHRALKVAGPNSVRVDSRDAWTSYSGASWAMEASGQAGGTGWFNHGFAKRMVTIGDKVTIKYHCHATHNLYLGTSLYSDRGKVIVKLDGATLSPFDAYLNVSTPLVTRRAIATSVAAGAHTVELTLDTKHASSSNYYFYFDFIEAAVESDVPDALPEQMNVTAAIDYGTDHGYKLSPARLLWMQDQLGLAGELNVYVSVFWWNQRKNTTRSIPTATVTIPGAGVVAGNNVFIDVSGSPFGHFVVGGDTDATVAAAIAAAVNATAVGVWASSSGADVIVTNRSATYSFVLTAWYETPAGGTVTTITPSGSLSGGSAGTWDIDETITPTLNIAARMWLADLLSECAARSRGVTLAYSLELLNPPSAWASRFDDGTAVTTATGFGSNATTHCAIGNLDFIDYQKSIYLETAALMDAAGLPIRLQFGEFCWWYFAGGSPASMAYYDSETEAAAATALGRSLALFDSPDDDPSVNSYDDADFLANRLYSHITVIRDYVIATYPLAVFECLLPVDVNYPTPIGPHSIGGRLNRHVNIPDSFLDPASAPFDLLKVEALDFGKSARSWQLQKFAIDWGFEEGTWPKPSLRYLLPIYDGGCPWEREYRGAVDAGIPLVVLFSFDHICLMNWPMPLP